MKIPSVSRLMRMRRVDRRALEHARRNPELGGIREGVAEALGFGDPRSLDGSVERFRWLAHRWLTR